MEHKQANSARHQQFACTRPEPFLARLLLQRITGAYTSQQKQNRHEPRIENIHHNILILRILWVITEATNATKDSFVVVKIKDMVKQHQQYRHPTKVIHPMLAFHHLPSPNTSSILSWNISVFKMAMPFESPSTSRLSPALMP